MTSRRCSADAGDSGSRSPASLFRSRLTAPYLNFELCTLNFLPLAPPHAPAQSVTLRTDARPSDPLRSRPAHRVGEHRRIHGVDADAPATPDVRGRGGAGPSGRPIGADACATVRELDLPLPRA